MARRPKYYDRPGKRPGPPKTPKGGGSYVDQKGKADEDDQMIVGYCEFGIREDGSFWTSGV